MNLVPHVPRYQIGQTGAAADVEGLPAMPLAQQPDAVIDAGEIGPCKIRAASVRGSGHRYDATPRQDDFCFDTAGPADEWLVAVVADGVSAGPRSHIAARVTVRIGVQLVVTALEDGSGPDAIDWDELVGTVAGHVLLQARKDSNDETLDASAASKLMASTAAFVIMPLDSDEAGDRWCTVLPIGDTSVWILRAGGAWESVTHIKNDGEAVASSATFALPLLPATAIEPLAARLGSADALFVVTDGIGDPLGSGVGEVGTALATVWAEPPNRYEFAAQVDFNRRSHTDDRTVIGIWPDRAGAPEADLVVAEPDAARPAAVNLVPGAPSATPAPAPAPAAVAPAVTPSPVDPAPSQPLLPEVDVPTPDPIPGPSTWEPTPWEPTPWSPETPAPQDEA